ncbi:Kelch motif family protein [Histomonas meleagridis]|uniref:Kelch motif family protein n=1 Tax=Histomonas meleagridis TaxID=135588 RepID=UPI00355A4A48|nr:Kelch motif family protein [Histomonas meleagridis]KAH0804439.1 Kelch motif family protein [Histomonas meleagridis]
MHTLSMKENPLKSYPMLLQTQHQSKFSRPDYYLYQSLAIPKDSINLYLTVKHNTALNIPKFPINLNVVVLNTITAEEICNKIQNTFECETTVKYLIIDNEIISKNTIIGPYINFENPVEISVKIEFAESAIRKFQRRANLLHEIKQTEQQFLDDLKYLIDVWNPQFKAKGILSDSERELIFHDFPEIQKSHYEFYTALSEAERNNYAANVGCLFLEYEDKLRSSVNYISLYPSINELICLKKVNRAFASTLSELQQMNDGRDLMSYLITPIQRLPRYLLFLRELIKITPHYHLDAQMLPLATEVIDKINKDADVLTERAKQLTVLKKIEDKLRKYDVKFVDPQRRIVMLVEVSLQSLKKIPQAQLCLCNDIVFIYIDRGKTAKLLFYKAISIFHYLPIIGEFRSILIPYIRDSKGKTERRELYVTFSKLEEKTQFSDNLQRLLDEISYKQSMKPRMMLWSLNSISDSLPSICQHNCISNNRTIIFLGGVSSSQRLVCSDFSSYHQNNTLILPEKFNREQLFHNVKNEIPKKSQEENLPRTMALRRSRPPLPPTKSNKNLNINKPPKIHTNNTSSIPIQLTLADVTRVGMESRNRRRTSLSQEDLNSETRRKFTRLNSDSKINTESTKTPKVNLKRNIHLSESKILPNVRRIIPSPPSQHSDEHVNDILSSSPTPQNVSSPPHNIISPVSSPQSNVSTPSPLQMDYGSPPDYPYSPRSKSMLSPPPIFNINPPASDTILTTSSSSNLLLNSSNNLLSPKSETIEQNSVKIPSFSAFQQMNSSIITKHNGDNNDLVDVNQLRNEMQKVEAAAAANRSHSPTAGTTSRLSNFRGPASLHTMSPKKSRPQMVYPQRNGQRIAGFATQRNIPRK